MRRLCGGMLDSGQILLLTFARKEGETGWRPLAEIMPPLDSPAPQPVPDPVLRSPPPPLVEDIRPRGNAAQHQSAPAQVAGAAPVLDAKPSTTLKIACPTCGQHILVDQSHAGMTGACPTCGGQVVIPAAAAALPSIVMVMDGQPAAGRIHGLAHRLTGLRPLEGFRISHLFADVFKNRSRADFETLFNTGLSSRAPEPAPPAAPICRGRGFTCGC